MSNHNAKSAKEKVPYAVEKSGDQFSAYGGLPTFKKSVEQLGVADILRRAKVQYGESGKTEDLSLLLLSAPFVEATSQRKVTQRFGGEPSEIEGDKLLRAQTSTTISQRTLNRFVNKERYDWLEVQAQRVTHLQQLPQHKPNRKGVVILDDWPLVKPFAKQMPYLGRIWDNNLKCSVLGYAIVHLYYHHPRLSSYSIGMAPWLKQSLTGEKKSKKQARRAAKPDEERNKMDVGLQLIDRLLGGLHFAALIFDNWYTSRWFGYELTQRGLAWIGDASATQKFEVAGDYLRVDQIYREYPTFCVSE